jgi:hypothetical protein
MTDAQIQTKATIDAALIQNRSMTRSRWDRGSADAVPEILERPTSHLAASDAASLIPE